MTEPADRQAEAAVLASIVAGATPHEAIVALDTTDFSDGRHRRVWDAICGAYADDGTVDRTAVVDRLSGDGITNPAALLHGLVSAMPTGANLARHVDRVADLSRRRRIIDHARELARAAADLTSDVDKTVDAAVERVLSDNPGGGLVTVEDIWDDVIDAVRSGPLRGTSTGWNALDRLYTVPPGYMTVVTGIGGAGKSELVNAIAINLARSGWRFAMFAPEWSPPARHAKKLIHTFLGYVPAGMTDQVDLDRAMAFVDDHFTFLDDLRDNTLDGILARARYAARRKQIDGLVVDPWNKVSHGYGDRRQDLYLQDALGRFTRFARKTGVHVWIVAHPTKMRKEAGSDTRYEVAGPFDISGGAEWFNQSDAILSMWRDRASEKRDAKWVDVHVQKIREEGEWGRIGRATLAFDTDARRYVEEAPV